MVWVLSIILEFKDSSRDEIKSIHNLTNFFNILQDNVTVSGDGILIKEAMIR